MTWPNIYRNLKRIDYCTEQFNMIRSHSQSRPCQSCTMMFHHDAYQCCVGAMPSASVRGLCSPLHLRAQQPREVRHRLHPGPFPQLSCA